MTGPKRKLIDSEREKENEEARYWELGEDEVNDEEITRYKRFGVG